MTEQTVVFHLGAQASGGWLLRRCLRDHGVELAAGGVDTLVQAELDRAFASADTPFEPAAVAALLPAGASADSGRIVVGSHDAILGPSFGTGGLYPQARPRLEALAEAIAGLPRRIVVSIRPQMAFVEGRYLELVNSGSSMGWSEWLSAVDLEQLSWQPVLDDLCEVFGTDAIGVLDARSLDRGRAAYLAEFFRVAAIAPPASLDDNDQPIAALSEKGVRLALAANAVLASAREQTRVRDFLLRSFSDRDYPSPRLLTDEQRRILSEQYDEEYERIFSSAGERSGALSPDGSVR